MSDLIYRPLIEDMEWSYSRITSYNDCPYKWFLKYIKKYPEEEQFFSSYGSLIHKIIDKYYKNDIEQKEMCLYFLLNFAKCVKGNKPQESVVQKYIDSGVSYFKNFKPFPYNTLATEEQVKFEIDGLKFQGIIDYIGEKDGNLCIIDNKSRNLKPRSKRKKQTRKDEELDNMLRQLYLYSAAVKQKYNQFPNKLCFNCFRNGVFIEEPFDENKYYENIEWIKHTIDDITNSTEFKPNIDYFKCNYLCGLQNECCYYQEG